MNYLVICPLKIELKYLLEAFSEQGFKVENRTSRLPFYWVPDLGLHISLGGHGKTQFAIQTQHLLSQTKNIDGVFCTGAGGGLAPHLKMGDIVVAEKTIEHDYEEKFNLSAKRPEFINHDLLLFLAKNQKSTGNLNIHFGSIASGDEDIVSPSRADELYEQTGALAVAWEGSGGARACAFSETPYLEIRAITDNARSEVSESFAQNLKLCMNNAALLLIAMTKGDL